MRPSPGRARASAANREDGRAPEVARDHQPALIGPSAVTRHRTEQVQERLREQQRRDRGARAVRGPEMEHQGRDRDAVADERDPATPSTAAGTRGLATQDVASPDSLIAGSRGARVASGADVRNREPSVTGSASPRRGVQRPDQPPERLLRDALRFRAVGPWGATSRRATDVDVDRSSGRWSRAAASEPASELRDERLMHGGRVVGIRHRGRGARPRGTRNSSAVPPPRADRLRGWEAAPIRAVGDGTERCRTGCRAAERAPRRRGLPPKTLHHADPRDARGAPSSHRLDADVVRRQGTQPWASRLTQRYNGSCRLAARNASSECQRCDSHLSTCLSTWGKRRSRPE